jgi:uncharacterized repeat protein (TIGR01451 family)
MKAKVGHVRHTTALVVMAAAAYFSTTFAAGPDLEIRKSVDNPTPTVGQPVEFTVAVRNTGTLVAPAFAVKESLPPELRIPVGMGVFVSSGYFDPVSNVWSLAGLAPGASATLVMPAIVAVTNPPACSVNVAELDVPYDEDRGNNRATAAVKQNATDRCADVTVSFRGISLPECGYERKFDFHVDVANNGPDEARSVIVDLSQNPDVAPNLRFAGATCSGTRCTFAAIAPGSTVTLQVRSDDFSNHKTKTLTFGLVASSTDTDYSTANNQARVDITLPVFEGCDYGYDCHDGGTCGWFVGDCFIATAAYGSALEPHVVELRKFRDRYLRRSEFGRAFIGFYYRHSPPLARFIAAHPSARFATRMLLTPLVVSIADPVRALALAVITLALWVGWRVHRRRLVATEEGEQARRQGASGIDGRDERI